jgi:hypothetical protein
MAYPLKGFLQGKKVKDVVIQSANHSPTNNNINQNSALLTTAPVD